MGYSKLYYLLLDLKKKVVIFACFNVMIYIDLSFFFYLLVCVFYQLDFLN
jgi:hypothetical protein